MHSYRERLYAPVFWWISGMIIMLTFGSIVWTFFPLWATLATFAVLLGGTAALLGNWGRATIEIYGAQLWANGNQVALAEVGEVRQLDETQARVLRGPRADPRAYLLLRPYLHKAVYVQVAEPGAGAPYWLLFTRHPAELAAAIESSRPAQRAGSAAMG